MEKGGGNDRQVKVDGSVVFQQEKDDEKGTFRGAFSHLALP